MISQEDYEQIRRSSDRRISVAPTAFHRYLFGQINWKNRLIGIKGAKGCGKTTLMFQHIKEEISDKENALYISLDDLWFTTHDVKELVDYFWRNSHFAG